MSLSLAQKKGVQLTVIANDKLAVYSPSPYKVIQLTQGSLNIPAARTILFSGSGSYLSGVLSSSASSTVIIQAGDRPLFYATGTGPVIPEAANLNIVQVTPGTLNATGTLTAALILGNIVTSTTAAAVAGTLDTGAVMDAVMDSAAINDAVDWTVVNTGASNAFTVTASTGHTIVGSGVVALSTSGSFRSRRTAAATWVTYRL